MRPIVSAILALSMLLLVAACSSSPAAGGPEAVAQDALAKVEAKDIEGLRGLACAGQEDLIRDQLSLAGMVPGSDLLAGLDLQVVLDAVAVDVADVEIGAAVTDGDVAQVPLSGTMKVTFNADAMRPILEQLLESQGATMTDDQLDALLKTLESYGQDVPVDQSLRLVREAGAWKICQEELTAPAPS
jgi:hypothetical protein